MSNEEFEEWMLRLWTKIEALEKRIDQILGSQNVLNGEILLDNQDLCFQLKVSKRSLQRYRSEGKLKYMQIEQKTYYYKSDVEEFLRKYMLEIDKDREENTSEE
ncbi:MAG: helix-turn-helix domain-containing protein [Dysgonomonas mossii]|uniref:helix-turn-helix domain-containing protein n=1 Tax=Dysgonomonas mossii TaxID=163665 RepID=UPI0039936326